MYSRRSCSLLTPLKRRGVILYTAYSIGYSALLVLIPLLLGWIVDALIAGSAWSLFLFVLFAVASFGALKLDWKLKRTIRTLSRDWEMELQIRLLTAFQALPPGKSDRFPPGGAALKFFRDAAMLGEFLRSFYPQILGAACASLFALIAVMFKSFVVAGLFLIFIPLLIVVSSRWQKTFRRLRRSIRRFNDSAINRIFECMHILPYLKSLSADAPYTLHTRCQLQRYSRLNRKQDGAETDFEKANRIVLCSGECTILAVSCILASTGAIQVGDVVVFQTLFLSVLNSLGGIFHLLPNLANVRESRDSVNEVLAFAETERLDTGTMIRSVAGDIVADRVSFAYSGRSRKILDRFSCVIPGGSIVCITGENGAGKTTLLKLLTGYLFPTGGKISVDGIDLRQCNLRAFRDRVASVFQEMLLITGSIQDNISLRSSRYTAADLASALELSGADSLVARMPDGLAHRINFNDGGGLSGGERQKLAIARALIRRPDILIFDEVTNHLDYESRLKMRDLLARLRGRTTVLLVSHDPELTKLCDQEIRLSTRE